MCSICLRDLNSIHQHRCHCMPLVCVSGEVAVCRCLPTETNRTILQPSCKGRVCFPISSSAMAYLFTRHCLLQRAPLKRCWTWTAKRRLHLAPPFLLDDYTPRYLRLSSRDAAKKRSLAYAHLRNCNLCPRLCGVNRYETTGMCLIGDKAKVNVIAPHFGEGP